MQFVQVHWNSDGPLAKTNTNTLLLPPSPSPSPPQAGHHSTWAPLRIVSAHHGLNDIPHFDHRITHRKLSNNTNIATAHHILHDPPPSLLLSLHLAYSLHHPLPSSTAHTHFGTQQPRQPQRGTSRFATSSRWQRRIPSSPSTAVQVSTSCREIHQPPLSTADNYFGTQQPRQPQPRRTTSSTTLPSPCCCLSTSPTASITHYHRQPPTPTSAHSNHDSRNMTHPDLPRHLDGNDAYHHRHPQ